MITISLNMDAVDKKTAETLAQLLLDSGDFDAAFDIVEAKADSAVWVCQEANFAWEEMSRNPRQVYEDPKQARTAEEAARLYAAWRRGPWWQVLSTDESGQDIDSVRVMVTRRFTLGKVVLSAEPERHEVSIRWVG